MAMVPLPREQPPTRTIVLARHTTATAEATKAAGRIYCWTQAPLGLTASGSSEGPKSGPPYKEPTPLRHSATRYTQLPSSLS